MARARLPATPLMRIGQEAVAAEQLRGWLASTRAIVDEDLCASVHVAQRHKCQLRRGSVVRGAELRVRAMVDHVRHGAQACGDRSARTDRADEASRFDEAQPPAQLLDRRQRTPEGIHQRPGPRSARVGRVHTDRRMQGVH